MTDRVEVCPECDRSNIYRRMPSIAELETKSDKQYLCQVCGANFDEPSMRKRQNHSVAYRGNQRALLDADPEDYPK